MLPNKELYVEKATLCRVIECTRRLLESKHEVMKRLKLERFQNPS